MDRATAVGPSSAAPHHGRAPGGGGCCCCFWRRRGDGVLLVLRLPRERQLEEVVHAQYRGSRGLERFELLEELHRAPPRADRHRHRHRHRCLVGEGVAAEGGREAGQRRRHVAPTRSPEFGKRGKGDTGRTTWRTSNLGFWFPYDGKRNAIHESSWPSFLSTWQLVRGRHGTACEKAVCVCVCPSPQFRPIHPRDWDLNPNPSLILSSTSTHLALVESRPSARSPAPPFDSGSSPSRTCSSASVSRHPARSSKP